MKEPPKFRSFNAVANSAIPGSVTIDNEGVLSSAVGRGRRLKRGRSWVDTNTLRRVGVELDDEWCHEQTGNIMYDHAAGAAAGHA
jgi:hypothetical protein